MADTPQEDIDSGNLPSWKGASRIYSRLYALLATKAAVWVTRIKVCGRTVCCQSIEMTYIIDALGVGDEHTLKGLALQYLDDIENAIQSKGTPCN